MSHSDIPTLPVPHPTRSFWHTTHPTSLADHRTTPSLPKRADVVVVGSGITGVFAARELLASGIKSVVVLEAREICSGATGRNGGHCQPLLYSSPLSSANFELRNFHFLATLIQTPTIPIPCEFTRFPRGSCHAYYSSHAFTAAKRAIATLHTDSPALAAQIDIIDDRSELAALRVPTAVGAVLQVHAAGLHPYKLVTWLWGQLLDEFSTSTKLNLQTNTPVTSISPSLPPTLTSHTQSTSLSHLPDRWTVTTPRGTLTTPQILLATNGYTAHLLPSSFRSLIVPVQGEMAALTPPPPPPSPNANLNVLGRKQLEHNYSFVGAEMDDYLVQRPRGTGGGQFMLGGGRRVAVRRGVGCSDDSACDARARAYLRGLLGRVMDLGEKAKESVEAVPVKEGWEFEGALTDGVSAGRAAGVTEARHQLHVEAEWTGIMGYSRDGCPWVGGVPGQQQEGLWVCGGYTGHGMPNASLSAIHVARLIAAASRGEDWRAVERSAVAAGDIPESYVVTEERMRRARRLPEVQGDVPMPQASL